MTSKFKDEIAMKLYNAVISIFDNGNVDLINIQYTDSGFFCDFDLPFSLNPEYFDKIKNHMNKEDISYSFEISNFSGVYKNNDPKDKVFQRIYITAFESKNDFDSYKEYLKLSSEHDHKKIGHQMNLFSNSDDIGAGLILWQPKGAMVRYLLEQFGQKAHILNGYQWVYTPHIGKAKLWETSGHLYFYKDSMYNPMLIDDERYYLKPMNCPFHINIYNSQIHSYRDLPVRLAEYGTVYRYELSGALNGMTRVRGFTQDDAHIICTPGQINEEVLNTFKFSIYVLRSFGLDDFKIYVSTKPETKYIGSEDEWNFATDILKNTVSDAGFTYDTDEGGGAFYGPKIDIKLKDMLGREWQCSTIQFDFNLPHRFDMTYIGNDGKPHTPYMVHRALFGSIERFTAMLIENFKGEFPLWLAPVQFAIVPVNQSHIEYCKKIELEFKKRGFRIESSYGEKHMKEKIKNFENDKIPYIFVIGDRDISNNVFSVRSRKEGNLGAMTMDNFLNFIETDLKLGEPRYIDI